MTSSDHIISLRIWTQGRLFLWKFGVGGVCHSAYIYLCFICQWLFYLYSALRQMNKPCVEVTENGVSWWGSDLEEQSHYWKFVAWPDGCAAHWQLNSCNQQDVRFIAFGKPSHYGRHASGFLRKRIKNICATRSRSTSAESFYWVEVEHCVESTGDLSILQKLWNTRPWRVWNIQRPLH